MIKKTFGLFTAILFSCVTSNVQAQNSEKEFIKENMEFAAKQYNLMLKTPSQGKNGSGVMPHSMRKDGTVSKGSIYLWAAGFFPGSLWYISDFLGDKSLQDSALVYTRKMEPCKTFTDNHDIGFMMYCSYGNANRFAPKTEYEDILTESAKSLCTRFRPKAGVIQSWNGFRSWHGDKVYDFPVIIDNMMNLELLFEATKLSGDSTFYNVAKKHADTTMANHFRADNSCYHAVDYDPETGEVRKKQTAQGYADESSWARGQAWALYGYTMCYRYTHDAKYLAQAEKVYNFIFGNKNLPEDLVPYWDFDAPKIPNEPRDASAAACTASALYELSTYVTDKGYKETADRIMERV